MHDSHFGPRQIPGSSFYFNIQHQGAVRRRITKGFKGGLKNSGFYVYVGERPVFDDRIACKQRKAVICTY
jgi:hypothetical protein